MESVLSETESQDYCPRSVVDVYKSRKMRYPKNKGIVTYSVNSANRGRIAKKPKSRDVNLDESYSFGNVNRQYFLPNNRKITNSTFKCTESPKHLESIQENDFEQKVSEKNQEINNRPQEKKVFVAPESSLAYFGENSSLYSDPTRRYF